MSSNEPPKGAASTGTNGAGSSANEPKIKPKPKGYTNPALQAMGIPRLRIPSRNWCIFWAVTGSLTAMYVYDRRERKKKRQEWKDRVSFMATQRMDPMQLPRKVLVYVAPSPGDYLETTMSHFRQYIKPILVAAAIDYEVRSESRQGDIRAMVAEEIRNQRRSSVGLPTSEDEKTIENRQLQESLTEHLEKNQEGGVICVGRGAYKEYMNGVHEGWLGPLEAPVEVNNETGIEAVNEVHKEEISSDAAYNTVDETHKEVNEIAPENAENLGNSEINEEPLTTDIHQAESETKPENENNNDNDKEEEDKKDEEKRKPVPKPYILGQDYMDAELPAEFSTLAKFDPIAAIPHEHIQGFKNIPIRIYRFFNRRQVANEIGEATAAAIFGHTRAFNPRHDDQLLVEEEDYWPNKWKKKGLESNSEWMREFIIDERVCGNMRVYDKGPELLSGQETSEFASDNN